MNPREESSDGFAVNELHGFRIKIFNCLMTGKNLPFSAASVKAGFYQVHEGKLEEVK